MYHVVCRHDGRQQVSESLIDVFEVPGALAIHLHAKLLAKTGRYSAIVAAALVIDGGIYRHEFVAQTVVNALRLVQLESTVTNCPRMQRPCLLWSLKLPTDAGMRADLVRC